MKTLQSKNRGWLRTLTQMLVLGVMFLVFEPQTVLATDSLVEPAPVVTLPAETPPVTNPPSSEDFSDADYQQADQAETGRVKGGDVIMEDRDVVVAIFVMIGVVLIVAVAV